jgi:hypothetical protein
MQADQVFYDAWVELPLLSDPDQVRLVQLQVEKDLSISC